MSFRCCIDCSAPITGEEPRCDECRPTNRNVSFDPYLVAAGLDLYKLETTRSYRQSKFRKGRHD